ncbi:hypothetical protein QO009_003048 [Brevibacillus aydinogluensis]|uniref:hypothetical protein n=1 Tax=Brevibacillus aydinogluensis TaxID=927786 RepID=UPI0028929EEA|nr:hypothetical protein [Brevibacillus aydinogluensis]MDT3417153.1 hypothetical protein [Brevibacillus aydinogluensis]
MKNPKIVPLRPKDPKQQAIWQLKQNPEAVLEQLTVIHLESKDLDFWKRFCSQISGVLRRSYESMKHELAVDQRNFFGLAFVVFASFMDYLANWEQSDAEKDMIYPLNYLDFFYLTSYLNAVSEAFPHYHDVAHKYLDQVLPTVEGNFEYAVELVMEYSRNLQTYVKA